MRTRVPARGRKFSVTAGDRRAGAALGVLLLGTALLASKSHAQAYVPAKGDGSWTVAYQNLTIHDHIDFRGSRLDRGQTDTHVLFVRLDYGLTDKLAVSVGVPYIKSKYTGAFPHEHDPFPEHRSEQEIDDGNYNGGLQDYSLGLRYQLRTEPFVLTPFLNVGYPSRDYTFHGHSAIGQRVWSVEVGAEAEKQLAAPLENFFVQGGYGYSVREEVEGISIRSSKVNLSLGYFLSERMSARLLAVWLIPHNGLDFPVDFPPAPDPLRFSHDRVQKTESVNLGAGLTFQLNEDYTLFGNWLTTVDGKNAHALHNAFTVGINRSF